MNIKESELVFYLPIGERIMIVRKRRKLSKKELAEMLGVSVVTISNYESGKTKPPVQKLMKISMALDVPIDDLIGLSDSVFKSRYCNEDTDEFQFLPDRITME